jgi:hypothetical protein
MAQPQNKYYRPYFSDSESGSDTNSDSGSDSGTDSGTDSGSDTNRTQRVANQPNYKQFATDLQLTKAGGPDLPALDTQLQYTSYGLIGPNPIVDPSGNFPKVTTNKTTVTGIIMIDSQDRDKAVYPQPTAVTFRLPRVYKNVTAFQVIQIKLLSSFLYFRPDKNNLTIAIHENGRWVQNLYGIVNDSKAGKNIVISTIRPGTYDINSLTAELVYQLNRTPIFYDYQNGFTDFAPLFATAGDYSLNFNQPGDNFYDAVNQTFIKNPTTTQIVQKYFQTLYGGLTSYTIQQIKVAYYYPVLKELLFDPNYGAAVTNFNIPNKSTLLDGETIFTRCVYTFQGLDDSIVQQVIDANISSVVENSLLDQYRLKNTFRFSLINSYSVVYSSNNNRITISSSSLNTSLVTLLTNKYLQYFNVQLALYGITQVQYNTLSLTNTLILAVLTDMYYYLQKNFAVYFGINFNSYSLAYFTNVVNQIPLQQGIGNVGVSSNYDANVILRNISPVAINTLSTFRTPSPAYWNRLTSLSTTVSSFINLNSNAQPTDPSQFSHAYNLFTDSADYTRPFIDVSGTIYQSRLLKSANIIAPVNPAEYTVFRFRSNSRQTLRVSALPRPTQYRYNAYNKATYDASHVQIFDNSYCFIYNARNSALDVSGISVVAIPGFSNDRANFGISESTSLALWNGGNITLDINTNRTFFSFVAPKVPGAASGQVDTYRMNVTIKNTLSAVFKDPIQVFLYHDRGAFMADISDVRHEKPIHYKTSATFSNLNKYEIDFTAYASQTYYVMVRSQNTSFTTTNFIISPYFPNGTYYNERTTSLVGFDPLADPAANLSNFNYAQVADPDYVRLPTDPTLYTSNAKGTDSNFYSFSSRYVPLGYDKNQVSSDLTDYVGYVPKTLSNVAPNSVTRIDPISGYIFQVGNGYNLNTQTYLYNSTSSGNGNQILTSNAGGAYTSNIIPPVRQTVIAHWYSQIFIPNTANQRYIPPNTYSLVYDSNVNTGYPTTLYSYPYVQDLVYPDIFSQYIPNSNVPSFLQGYAFSDNTLSLGDGVMGIGFVPDDGIWDVQRIMLRSAYIDSNADTNRNIAYLGIFPASYLNTLTGEQVKLASSLMTFDLKSAVTYSSTVGLNFGFDQVGGTYYEWTKSSNYKPQSNGYIYGYAQTPGTMNADSNSYYSIVPFDANSNITTYSLLSGSLVPYPYYSDASASEFYLDHTSTPTGQYVISPKTKANPDLTRGPPKGFDQTQSKYEQSTPITGSLLQYLKPPLLVADPSGCKPFGPPAFRGITGEPSYDTPCFRVPNYALFPSEGNYKIYRYENNTPTRNFTLKSTLTPDEFFRNSPNTQIVSISGNNTEFAFLGLQRMTTVSSTTTLFSYNFNIETYNISTQTTTSRDIFTVGYDSNSMYTIPQSNTIIKADSFNYNDNRGFTFAFEYGVFSSTLNTYLSTVQIGLAKGSPTNDPSQPLLVITNLPGNVPGIQPYYELLQSAYEPFGRFYVAAKTRFARPSDLSGGQVFYKAPTNLKYTLREPMLANHLMRTTDQAYFQNGLFHINPLKLRSFNTDVGLINTLQNLGTPYVYTMSNLTTVATITRINLNPGNQQPAAFGDITLVQNPYENKVFLSYDMYDMSNNSGIPSVTYSEVANLTFSYSNQYASNSIYFASKQVITAYDHTPLAPYKIVGGGRGSFWSLFNENNRVTQKTTFTYDTIWGNRGDSTDFHIGISNAYQIFFPTQRLVLQKVGLSYNPITDLSGIPYPEYPHTALFAYDSFAKYVTDISSNKWGLESNYLTADTTLKKGYYFNACDLDVPLYPNSSYYLALRGYSPTEKSQVMLRFSLPNRYDFGYVRLTDLSNEIVYSGAQPLLFNSNYANTIQAFNSNFVFDSNGHLFGSNIIQGFPGSNFSNVNGFGDFLNQFINLYNTYNNNVQILSNINTVTQSNIQSFIRHDLSAIIPASAVDRQRYTDPIVYSILWKTALLPQYQKADDNWGLGWNLGFSKEDTPYLTTQTGQSFFKILDDYINLRMNPEFNLNMMDTGSKENLQITQDTTGSIKAYYGKLLLAPFGSYAQTMISNPITFQIPIRKIDKLTFTWVDNFGNTINNNDCDWNVVIQLVEQFETATAEAEPLVLPH